jgi:hypothetical protein
MRKVLGVCHHEWEKADAIATALTLEGYKKRKLNLFQHQIQLLLLSTHYQHHEIDSTVYRPGDNHINNYDGTKKLPCCRSILEFRFYFAQA